MKVNGGLLTCKKIKMNDWRYGYCGKVWCIVTGFHDAGNAGVLSNVQIEETEVTCRLGQFLFVNYQSHFRAK